jgi:hypothetical protein
VSDSAAALPRRAQGNFSPGPRLLELAVDTDYEFARLFTTPEAAAEYVVTLYAATAAISERDANVRLALTWVRIWDRPDPGLASGIPDDVHRDVIHQLSGNASLGSVGGLGALCTGNYGAQIAQLAGHFDGAGVGAQHLWDLYITAHELGHNFGSPHTHCFFPPIDQCFPCLAEAPVTTRGTLMSYCVLRPGGLTNIDLRYHRLAVDAMQGILAAASCLGFDCNANGVDDADDIALGAADVNSDGVPDACQDCDDDGVLDPLAIAAGEPDVDANGIPDACQSDCNANGVPDPTDVATETSVDANGDRVPDECASDCDGDGIADPVQVATDMGSDVDRDRIPDSCSDCDGDGVDDRTALNGAHGLWVGSDQVNSLRRFNARSGVWEASSTGTSLAVVRDLRIAPGGAVMVATADRVERFDQDGTWLDTFIPPGSGGLVAPWALRYRGDELWVGDRGPGWGSVRVYDGASAVLLRTVIASNPSLTGLADIGVGFDGALYVLHANRVTRFDSTTGALIGEFVVAGDGGNLSGSRSMLFNADGRLLVAAALNNSILEYDALTGDFIQRFNLNGQVLRAPWCLRAGPTGNVFVAGHQPSSTGSYRLLEYQASSGQWYRHSYISGGAESGLLAPTAFDFVPGGLADCNANLVPDGCDLSSGNSLDANGDDVPDECQVDCNANGKADDRDILPHGISTDCNFNRVPDECELTIFDCNANGVHDACDVRWFSAADCNYNTVPDSCELAVDCNSNAVPDGCEQDFDGDGLIDDCDADDDNDGVDDALDGQPFEPTRCQDIDQDGCDDCAVGSDGTGPESDADPTADGPDADADGLCDEGDACPFDAANDADGDHVCEPFDVCAGSDDGADHDADGVPDGCDNCPEHANSEQDDCDSDGMGDVCTIAAGAEDHNFNGVPDGCEPALLPVMSGHKMIMLVIVLACALGWFNRQRGRDESWPA